MAIKINGTTVISDDRELQNISDIDHMIPTPNITAPVDASTNVGSGVAEIDFTLDDYYSLYGVSQGGIEVEVSSSTNFSSPLLTLTDSGATNTVGYTTSAGTLATSTTYYARARYYDSNNVYSAYSPTISFTTAAQFVAVSQPSITSPSNGATDQGEYITFTSDAFGLTSGTGTHVSSDWQIATDAGFTNIVDQALNSTANKTSYTNTTGLNISTTYYVRVRYTSQNYGSSSYSSTVSFTTAAAFAGEEIYSTNGSYVFTPPTGVDEVSIFAVSGSSGTRGGASIYGNGLDVSSAGLAVCLAASNVWICQNGSQVMRACGSSSQSACRNTSAFTGFCSQLWGCGKGGCGGDIWGNGAYGHGGGGAGGYGDGGAGCVACGGRGGSGYGQGNSTAGVCGAGGGGGANYGAGGYGGGGVGLFGRGSNGCAGTCCGDWNGNGPGGVGSGQCSGVTGGGDSGCGHKGGNFGGASGVKSYSWTYGCIGEGSPGVRIIWGGNRYYPDAAG